MEKYKKNNHDVPISVLLSTWNQCKFLKKTIDSILNQTFTNFELIVIDDGSIDGTNDLLTSIRDDRIKIYTNDKNMGFVPSRNRLIKFARGYYIAFADHDDIWDSTKLEKQYNFLCANDNIDVCFTTAKIIDENDSVYEDASKCDVPLNLFNQDVVSSKDLARQIFYNGNCISHSSTMIKLQTLKDIGDFNARYFQLQDMDYWTRVLLNHDIEVMKEPLVYMRRVSGGHTGMSRTSNETTIRSLYESMEIILNFIANMSKEKFINFFDEEILERIEDKNDLLCEKFFLLTKWNCCGKLNNLPALLFYKNNYTYEFANKLETKYNFSMKDYYKITGTLLDIYPITFYNEYNKLNNLYSDALNAYKDVSEQLNNVYNTKSWKLTRPLRRISSWFHMNQ